MAALKETIDAADDAVFSAFCKKIGVKHIREYEDVQLKVAREENEAIERWTQAMVRAGHQIEFEKSQLSSTQERLASLRSTVERAKKEIKGLQKKRAGMKSELEELQAEIDRQKAKLEEATAKLEAAHGKVEEARDASRRTQRSLDKALKEIASWNDEIERGASDRFAIYRRCRLEEIELPLVKGSLSKVPIEEVSPAGTSLSVRSLIRRPGRRRRQHGCGRGGRGSRAKAGQGLRHCARLRVPRGRRQGGNLANLADTLQRC